MTPDQAKEILSAARPGAAGDACPPGTQAARDLAAADPALRDWAEDQSAFDRHFSKALRSVEVPADLKASLLAAAAEARAHDPGDDDLVGIGAAVAPPGRVVRGPWLSTRAGWLAAVATLLIGFSLWVLIYKPDIARPQHFADLRHDLAESAKDGLGPLKLISTNPVEISDYFRSKEGAVVPCDRLPGQLPGLEKIGCKVFDWNQHQVSLVCVRKGGGDAESPGSEVVHIFAIDCTALVDPPESVSELDVDGMKTAAWCQDGVVYIIIGNAPGVEVNDVL